MTKCSIILLAGGIGTRMNSPKPKQFLELLGRPLISYSFDFFKSLPTIKEIIVVCEPFYHYLFETNDKITLKFALPGLRRQDSVYNGLQEVAHDLDLVIIHDGARPILDKVFVTNAINEAFIHGAATVAVPLKFTVKEKNGLGFIKKTLDRSSLYEVQTPQIIRQDLLKEGFKFAIDHDLEVTDDVSLVELIKKPVKFVMGSYQNIKITTQEDLLFAECIMRKNNATLL